MSKTASPSKLDQFVEISRRPIGNGKCCIYCFEELGKITSSGESTRPASLHRCVEMLLARQPAAPVPFN